MLLSLQIPCPEDTHVLPDFVAVMSLYCRTDDSRCHGITAHCLTHIQACCMHLATLVYANTLKGTHVPRIVLHVNCLTCI